MVPGAAVEFAADQAALLRSLPTARLLLINRTLDGEYDLQTGVELIRQLKDAPQPPRAALMLVSNFPEAQAEALAAGAVPGFGKRDMYSPETKRRILDAIAGT
jgi:CheY-like chemotaxis protein